MSDRAARYRDALAIPHVLPTFGAALIGRSAYALVFLPLLYAVSDATGSIALAGLAVALYGAGASFLAPVRAWLIDHHGARPVLGVLLLLFGSTIAALAITSLTSGPSALLMALAILAGVVAPPLGPTMRVAWGALAENDALLRKGLSFDAVVEELLYLAGPAIAGLTVAVVAPGLALFVPAALVVIGGLLFVLSPTVGATRPRPRGGKTAERDRSLLADRRFAGILLPAMVAGGISGSLSVAVPVIVSDDGGSAAAGIALGLFAGGSAAGVPLAIAAIAGCAMLVLAASGVLARRR